MASGRRLEEAGEDLREAFIRALRDVADGHSRRSDDQARGIDEIIDMVNRRDREMAARRSTPDAPMSDRETTIRGTYLDLRDKTPDDPERAYVNSPGVKPEHDPLYPELTPETYAADHVVPLNFIVGLDGFTGLPRAKQLEIVNATQNLWPLSTRVNSSKRDRMPWDWDGLRALGPLSSSARDLLNHQTARSLIDIIDLIDRA